MTFACVLSFLANPIPTADNPPAERLLFDFEDATDVEAWSSLELPDASALEPAVRITQSAEHGTSGGNSLRLTFAGGQWPTISTARVPGDWMPYGTFAADVWVERTCVVGFTALQERSQRGGGWDATVSRWTKTAFCQPGTNHIVGTLHDPNNYSINAELGPVERLEMFVYQPHDGESIWVDNVRISTVQQDATKEPTAFLVAGGEGTVSGVRELGEQLRDQWQAPEQQTLAEVEAEFCDQHERLLRQHPRAVLAVFRDGQAGFDPADPGRKYTGWTDAYWSSHGPDGETVERARNTGSNAAHEVFMRHRSPLMRVDLSSIPAGATILAARLIVVRAYEERTEEHRPDQPNLWVVEPCNRPWVETEVNAYQYAHDQFWRAIGGMDWAGDDPDFWPVYLAYGPSQGRVNWWDFTEAVRFWTSGEHENHGFMLHGNAGDWFVQAHSREAERIEDRPSVLVSYVAKP
jgi:hypothetical protein